MKVMKFEGFPLRPRKILGQSLEMEAEGGYENGEIFDVCFNC